MNKIVSNLRAKTGPQHLFEYNLQNVVKTNNNKKTYVFYNYFEDHRGTYPKHTHRILLQSNLDYPVSLGRE